MCATNVKLKFMIVLLTLPVVLSGTTNFRSCMQEIQNGTWGSVGGTDNYGHPVSNISTATGITYDLCVRACGAASEPFHWFDFSQQFSSWLLPWLAMLSQLPFGANDKLDNLLTVLLTVGSPTLAAYSLALTVLNGRWIARRFAEYNTSHTRHAVQILSSLQQSPLKVITRDSLLMSLVVLPENNKWWVELIEQLDYTYTWSISAVASIAWVVIAYGFTLIDSFSGDPTATIQSTGQGIGSLWLWLLTIVVGWLQLSPKCDSARLRQAIDRANKHAYIVTSSGRIVLAKEHAFSLPQSANNHLQCDELCTSPIYNYARFLPWNRAVEDICEVFEAASDHTQRERLIDLQDGCEEGEEAISLKTRVSSISTLREIEICHQVPIGEPAMQEHRRMRDIWSRMIVASILALLLQWSTIGAGILVAYFTPTAGIGCRSGAYTLYGSLSTFSWMILVLSSVLTYYSTTTPQNTTSASVARRLAIGLRRLGKTIASVNAVWIVVSCLFQFSNFYDRCYCNSCVISRGARAFNVIIMNQEVLAPMKSAWLGGAFFAAGGAVIYLVFVNVFINPELPE